MVIWAQAEALKARTRQFALDVIYRAACRGRSRAEFAARIGVVAEEADESAHWLDMLATRHCEPRQTVQELLSESRELEAIFSASHGTARNLARARV